MSESTHTSSPTGGYEKSDADARSLTKFGVGLAVIGAVVLALMFAMLKFLGQQQRASQPAKHPLSEASQMPPEPRLQIAPEIDLEKFRANEDHQMNSYGWVMKDAGVVHIPIDSAMAIVAKRGLPARSNGEEREAMGERREAKSVERGAQP